MLAFRLPLPFFLVLLVFAIAGPLSATCASGQGTKPSSAPAPQPQEENLGGQEVELVKPVVWSLREVYTSTEGGAWGNMLFIRADRVLLKKNRLTRNRGSILRWDIPLAMNSNGRNTRAGLGDIYLQDILIPYLGRTFAFGAGAGLTLPTATDARLGDGKWIASPIVAPVWLFRRKGFLVLKLQDDISFAGDSKRSDIHRLSVRPIFVWRFRRWWWTQVEAESFTNFVNSSRPWFWTGVALGRMMNRRTGVWVKPEIAWGPYRPYDFAIKVSVLTVK